MVIKKMKIKRVGLVTMGLSLISLGIIMLLDQFNILDGYMFVLKLWPSMLIILGIEVLYNNYLKNKNDDIDIRIDFISVIIIFIVIFTNIFIYFAYNYINQNIRL